MNLESKHQVTGTHFIFYNKKHGCLRNVLYINEHKCWCQSAQKSIQITKHHRACHPHIVAATHPQCGGRFEQDGGPLWSLDKVPSAKKTVHVGLLEGALRPTQRPAAHSACPPVSTPKWRDSQSVDFHWLWSTTKCFVFVDETRWDKNVESRLVH